MLAVSSLNPLAMQLVNQDCSLDATQEEVISSGEEDKAEWNNENHAIEMSGACIQLQTEIEKEAAAKHPQHTRGPAQGADPASGQV